MIIRTIQQANALDCCPCDFPQCDAPRKECESITIPACGFTLPEHDDVTLEDACQIYRKRSDTFADDTSFSGPYDPVPGDSYDYENHRSQTDTRERWSDVSGVCETRYFSGEYSFTESALYGPTGGSPTDDWIYSESATAGADGVYSGTWTYTDNLDAGNNASGASSLSPVTEASPDNTWDYTSPGIYVLITVDGIVTFTSTVTFSEPVNATHLEANLDELIADLGEDPWPDDGCASALTQNQVFDESDPPELLCEKLVGATKARYRFGPPVDYTRSTWEMEWDLVFASTEWWTWFDAGATGTEPTPGPSLVSHQSWVWDSEAEWSDWYEIPLPTEPGETRVVNVLTTCWKSTRIGTKPTASGPEVALPE